MRFGLDRPLLESAENKWGTTGVATTVSGYVYRYDELGRRTGVVRTAWAFAALDRAYTYDPIGDRTESVEGTAAVEYGANSLNQYQIKSSICRSVCSAKPPKRISILGWSRGGVAALRVAELLNREGCCCATRKERKQTGFLDVIGVPGGGIRLFADVDVCCDKRYPKIDFLGLFDPVDRRPGACPKVPPNVATCVVAIAGQTSVLFPTVDVCAESSQTNVIKRLMKITAESEYVQQKCATSFAPANSDGDQVVRAT